ncbi:Laminin subunit alpha-2 [Grifola frondosa]|uniref:Laminin subunit alpha-2 n=1 Tax=Grifola frondosa TaxID=5627 RepID=A0A1C7MQN8_GRIFR|nr:Laminin subunit alpha-2 [Grifola frondosa]
MFSQFRHAVETLAQHSPKSSQDASATTDEGDSRSSLDSVGGLRTSISSSSQLAESALSNLRKTLVAQRSGSPGPSKPVASSSDSTPRPAAPRTTLEDRLRAKFAIGDVSNSSSPISSTRTSPSPIPVSMSDHPLSPSHTPLPKSPSPQAERSRPIPHSPTSIPLPDSPPHSPTIEAPSPVRPDLPKISLPEPLSASTSSESLVASQEPTAEMTLEQDHGVAPLMSGSEFTQGDCSSTVGSLSQNDENPPEVHGIPQSASEEDVHDVAAITTHSENTTGSIGSPELEQLPQAHIPLGKEDLTKDAEASSDSDALSTNGDLAHLPDNDLSPPETQVFNPDTDPALSILVDSRADEPDIEGLQKRLKLVEQRFSDVSTSFKRLQTEKLAADKVLQELTSVESVHEVDALRDYLQNLNFKTEMAQDEIKRLTGKLTRQEERIEELRDIHRLESKSQSDLIDNLRGQLDETEKFLKSSQSASATAEEESAKRKVEIDRIQAEVERVKSTAKDEEEKRVKAIALLKTVRQKLVKAEKERDDATKDIRTLKDGGEKEREKEKAEKAKLQSEIEKVNAERETAIVGLRVQFDKEIAAFKEKQDKEIAALKAQFELEAIGTKTSHTREIEGKNARISGLENSVQMLSKEKNELFDQLQMRQAELESSQSLLESLQGQGTELQFQIREANDRIALLTEELADARRVQDNKPGGTGPSAEEVTRLLSAAESKYETRISDLRRKLAEVERERDEGEAEWSRKLSEKTREIESLKGIVSISSKTREEELECASVLRKEIESLQEEIRLHQKRIADLQTQAGKVSEVETAAKIQLSEVSTKAANLQQLVEEGKSREAQLRAHNKTLRDELRKVQSSAALLEKQRNPGIGYWASRTESTSEIRSPRSSVSDLVLQDNSTSRPSSPETVKSDEEVNVEYLRNVIIQFLEHKEMRPHLVRILSTILRFTPQETRRIVSKV